MEFLFINRNCLQHRCSLLILSAILLIYLEFLKLSPFSGRKYQYRTKIDMAYKLMISQTKINCLMHTISNIEAFCVQELTINTDYIFENKGKSLSVPMSLSKILEL